MVVYSHVPLLCVQMQRHENDLPSYEKMLEVTGRSLLNSLSSWLQLRPLCCSCNILEYVYHVGWFLTLLSAAV